jgi:polar amino acid transport system permease protein
MSYFDFLLQYLPSLINGTLTTIAIFILSSFFGALAALLTAMLRLLPFRPVRIVAATYVEVFRGTSLLVQLFWLFYVFPLFGVNLDNFVTGVLAISLNLGAYGSEVVRGAIQSVPRGQYEASVALNLSPSDRMRRIILPQAILLILPPWGNLMIETLKATALLSLITVWELMAITKKINNDSYLTIEPFMTALVIYYILGRLLLSPTLRWFEKFWAKKVGMI